jgi:hypothetical protein
MFRLPAPMMSVTETTIEREGPVTTTINSLHNSVNSLGTIEHRHTQRDEMIRAAEREFVAAVGRALGHEETATHRTCAVQWAQILDGLRATRS